MDIASDKQIAIAKEITELFTKFESKPENRLTKGTVNTQLTRLDVSYQNFKER